ncbi:enoyl-CoA hydratase/isomerase family protein [Actinoalloteichus spitiensis]|uniref:enoyl-CoA hydratase/isomerase family protein n=1 Tax=Actinoalloteichus spitiensis TaxID=252394 RepID=UPI000367F0B9|nr:enoyl-CoA hydratase/isomerase family protein [Actinoalloteichus spitiensis]
MTVDHQYEDGIAWLHLNRPHRLNAVVPDLTEALIGGLRRAGEEGAAVVVVAGRGRAFCAGHDLREPTPEEDLRGTRARVERLQDVTREIRRFPGPVIAAVHGYALGAGCEFALACDLVVASEDASFGFPEVGVGLSVTGGVSRLLPLVVGPMRAKEALMLGERFDAATASELGLVNRVVPTGTHEDAARELAERLRERPRTALSLAKRVLDSGMDHTVEQAMSVELDHAVTTRFTAEADTGRQEFAQRRAGTGSEPGRVGDE